MTAFENNFQKRRAVVEALLRGPGRSNRELSDMLEVSDGLVGDVRKELEAKRLIPRIRNKGGRRRQSSPSSDSTLIDPSQFAPSELDEPIADAEARRQYENELIKLGIVAGMVSQGWDEERSMQAAQDTIDDYIDPKDRQTMMETGREYLRRKELQEKLLELATAMERSELEQLVADLEARASKQES